MRWMLAIVAIFIGGGLLSNFVTKMAVEQCARQCPQNRAALKSRFAVGPFELKTCDCKEVAPDATEEG